jgi:hypothetical protein
MRKTDRSLKSTLSFAAAALLAVGAATAQVANADTSFPGANGIDHSGSYQHEMNSCMSGKTQQDRDTCLKEARNAHADKQRGVLNTYGEHEQNAMARCDVFSNGEDKAACEARVLGYGSVDGSVAGGGLLRESETVVLPAGQHSVTIDPQTDNPVVIVPSR